MIKLSLTLTLLSDAEPGSGLGTETMDGLVPRDARGRPILPATHVKGLLRDRLEDLAAARKWPLAQELLAALLGEPDGGSTGMRVAALRLADAAPVEKSACKTMPISRTAISDLGTANQGSLRTVEAIAAGSRFSSAASIQNEPGSAVDLAARLGLMMIENVGGGRTRGAGLCRINIEGESRTPGTLLRELEKRLNSGKVESGAALPCAGGAEPVNLQPGPAKWFQLVFRAESPVCCPEIPVNGATNHIRSGPVVPASAVQGALITKLASLSTALADACFADARFRAWPLVPVLPGDAAEKEFVPLGIRVDLMHRITKLPDPNSAGAHTVRDAAIDPYHWSDVAGGSPLKSADGILRQDASGRVTLWKAAELPRVISGHGVHHDATGEGQRALFTVEALAPMVFSGLVALPVEAAVALEKALQSDPTVSFGKARSVRGMGRLELRTVSGAPDVLPAALPAEYLGRVFIVQSPLALPDDYQVGRAENALKFLAEKAHWGSVILSSTDTKGRDIPRSAATCGVRFGWNRHGIGAMADPRHRRLRARRVILPGSVLVLAEPLPDMAEKLLAGLGDGRESGFGCLLPHPGMAVGHLYRPARRLETIKSDNDAGFRALELFKKAGVDGPSPSQIAAVCRRVDGDALQHLKNQRDRGAVRHWHKWKPVIDDVIQLVQGNKELAKNTLRAWQDLAIIHRDGGSEDQP